MTPDPVIGSPIEGPIVPPPRARPPDLWAAVLAGGEGVRLRPLVHWLCGEERPKQFARLLGARSLLGDTLERVALGVALEQTVVVTTRRHGAYVEEEFRERPRPVILEQPDDRGTAAAVLFPASWIARMDPSAVLAVFPSDHFIPDGARFMAHVLDVAAYVARDPSRIVLLGVPASRPETEYGWIRRGPRLGAAGAQPVFAIQEFREKPDRAHALRCLARGDLWNTLVFLAPVRVLLELGRQRARELTGRIERVSHFVGGPLEPWALRQAYLHAPRVNFSQAILETCPDRLAVSRLPPMTWSDWGTPERVLDSLRREGLTPPWLSGLGAGDALAPGGAGRVSTPAASEASQRPGSRLAASR